MSDKCNKDITVIYVNIGIQMIYILIRVFVDYINHKKINNVNRGHKTMIIKNQLMHDKIDKINELISSKNKIESDKLESVVVIDNNSV